MTDLRPDEEWVRRVLEAALQVPVAQCDDGSGAGMHDLAILRPDRRDAVEVTAAADAESIELWRLVNGGDETWIVPGCAGGWMLWLDPSARAKRLQAELPEDLIELERQGEGEFRSDWPPGMLISSWARRLADLGVLDAHQGKTTRPGSVYLSIRQQLERTGGAVDPDCRAVPEWIAEFLSSPGCADVRAKLARSQALDRHAYVILPAFTTAAFGVRDALFREDGLPDEHPQLPGEITHVCLASTFITCAGLRWAPDAGWKRFQHLVIDSGSASPAVPGVR